MRVVETVRQPLALLDDELRVRRANDSFYENFQLSRPHTEGASIYDVGNGRWNTPELRTALDAARNGDALGQLPLGHAVQSGRSMRVIVNARGFELDDARRWILMALELVDEQEVS